MIFFNSLYIPRIVVLFLLVSQQTDKWRRIQDSLKHLRWKRCSNDLLLKAITAVAMFSILDVCEGPGYSSENCSKISENNRMNYKFYLIVFALDFEHLLLVGLKAIIIFVL